MTNLTNKINKQGTTDKKRVKIPRDSQKMSSFIKDWEKLSRSGKHDMNVLKEAMMLLIANDSPLPPEWKDHQLNGALKADSTGSTSNNRIEFIKYRCLLVVI